MHGAVDEGTRVKDFLELNNFQDNDYAQKIISLFNMSPLMDRGLRFLSTGEFRKVLLLSALLKNPDLLVIDDPFDGLDASSRKHLKEVINELIKTGCRLVLISGRIEDFSPEAGRMILLSEGSIKYSGEIRKGIELYRKEHAEAAESSDKLKTAESVYLNERSSLLKEKQLDCENFSDKILIEMIDTSVSYSGRKVIDKINWKVKKGEKWKICGVNGAGKSTLLSLVNGIIPELFQ